MSEELKEEDWMDEGTKACLREANKIHGRVYRIDNQQLLFFIGTTIELSRSTTWEKTFKAMKEWADKLDQATRRKEGEQK